MLSREQKGNIVEEFSELLRSARGVVLSSFQGLPTRDIQELRAHLRNQQIKYKVIKLSLLRRILQKIGVDTTSFNYQVPLAVSFSSDDEIMPAKVVADFAKKHERLKIVAGIIDQKLVEAAEVQQLASLPGKQELRGQLVSVIAGSLRALASVLSGNVRGLLNTLNAIKDSKA